jgi:hypothetical protein
MNRIVREHYPVEKLPEDLREGIPAGEQVTVTVEAETDHHVLDHHGIPRRRGQSRQRSTYSSTR